MATTSTDANATKMVCCNGFIYAIGSQSGQNLDTTTQSVEQFNGNEGRWRFLSSMITVRHVYSACVMNGSIFVVGGLDGSGNPVTTIECYDPASDSWNVVGNIDIPLYHHLVVAL